MPGQRFEGRNLDEAIEAAASKLGVPRYQIDHKVVVEKRGFLGGVKRIVIEAHVNPERTEAPAPPVAAPAASRPAAPASDRPRPRQRGDGSDRGRGRGPRGRGRRDDAFDSGPRRRTYETRYEPDRVPDQEEQSEAAAAIARWFDDLFDLAGFALEARTHEDEEQIRVVLYGRDGRLVLDREGELLDSLQTIANKAFRDKLTEKKIELDCRGFKEAREDELRREAQEAADLVRAEGGEQVLPAMNPSERRIVHLALKDDPDVATVSRGEGFFKRVAIVARELVAEESQES